MRKFSILAGLLAVLATGLMANKCGDVSFSDKDKGVEQNAPKPDVPQVEPPVDKPTAPTE